MVSSWFKYLVNYKITVQTLFEGRTAIFMLVIFYIILGSGSDLRLL